MECDDIMIERTSSFGREKRFVQEWGKTIAQERRYRRIIHAV